MSGLEGYYWFMVRDKEGAGWIYGEFLRVSGEPFVESLEISPRQPQTRTRTQSQTQTRTSPPVQASAETTGNNSKARAEQLVKEGQIFWNEENWAKAYERFDEAYRLDPADEVKLFRENAENNVRIGNNAPQGNNGRTTPSSWTGLNGDWSGATGSIEDVYKSRYNLTHGGLKISASKMTGDGMTMTLGGSFTWAWAAQTGKHMLPDNYGAVIHRRDVLFRKTQDGMYYASGSDWPPRMFIRIVDDNRINLMFQDENGSFVVNMRRK
jgi:hypothetical protein